MRLVLHPTHRFTLPPIFDRIAEHARSPRQYEQLCRALGVSWLPRWLRGEGDDAAELAYAGHPFELFPFAWQGGDALQYGIVVHCDSPLLTPVAVSYAPSDGPVWLGDDAAEGIRHLLAVQLRDAGDDAERIDDVQTIARALELEPLGDPPEELDDGARSERPADSIAPPGWTFEPCNDEIGVLAPEDQFDPDLAHEPDGSLFDLDRDLALVERLASRGFYGSALAIARNDYRFTAFDADHGARAAAAMRELYRAMGRDFLADRVAASRLALEGPVRDRHHGKETTS
jgi:hypothetical protein